MGNEYWAINAALTAYLRPPSKIAQQLALKYMRAQADAARAHLEQHKDKAEENASE